VSVFSRFHELLQEAIVRTLGWSSLRPVQELSGEALLDGKDAIILAPTAGGKTEAAFFPALSEVLSRQEEGVQILYIAPIKALLNNQADRLATYTGMVGLDRFVWHGDTKASQKKKFLRGPTTVLMTTPESLEVMCISEKTDETKIFSNLRFAIIDEIHALAGSDRGAHLRSVLARIMRLSRFDVQRIGLSATVGNPDDILDWIGSDSSREGIVIDPPAKPSRRQLSIVYRETEPELALSAAASAREVKSLLFCQSRSLAENIGRRLASRHVDMYVHHGSISKEERQEAEAHFQEGGAACIVCTSTLELGIDIGDLDKVLQVDAPSSVNSFLQRMGRTGRREGKAANTFFFCTSKESVLQAIALIELAKSKWVEHVKIDTRHWPVLVHQVLAMCLASKGIGASALWEHLSSVPDFSGIQKDEFKELIKWMIQDGSLDRVSGLLVMGEKAEKLFGRKNFMDMYAVFSTPLLYEVKNTARHKVGSLEQSFVDQLYEDSSSFLLSGRPWDVIRIDHAERAVYVKPGTFGTQPKWTSFIPQLLGYEICQKIRDIILSNEAFKYVKSNALDVLKEFRADLQAVLETTGPALAFTEDSTTWWTFAGGKVNQTLRYAINIEGGWTVRADNFKLEIKAGLAQRERIKQVLKTLISPSFWRDDRLLDKYMSRLPDYRLSKFQKVLPKAQSMEFIGSFLLDFPQTQTFLNQFRGQAVPTEQPDQRNQKEDVKEDIDLEELVLEDEPSEEEQYKTHLPVYSLKAVAASVPGGEWGDKAPSQYVEPLGWVKLHSERWSLTNKMFVAQIVGHSMDDGRSGLKDGAYVVFEFGPSRGGDEPIVLLRGAGLDPEFGHYAVKRLSKRGREGATLCSLNKDKTRYPDISLSEDDEVTVLASFLDTLERPYIRVQTRSSLERKSLTPGEKRERKGMFLSRALVGFFDERVTSEVAPETQRRDVDWTSAFVMRAADRGGLSIEFSPLQGLLGFIRVLTVTAGEMTIRMLASNLRNGCWFESVPPDVESYIVTADGFEDDEDVQEALSTLRLEGLSQEVVTVFKEDASGMGRIVRSNVLSVGQQYFVLVPPALVGQLDEEEVAWWEGDWCVLSWLLPEQRDQAWSERLESLGLFAKQEMLTLRPTFSARSYRMSSKGQLLQRYAVDDPLYVSLNCHEPSAVGGVTVIVASGKEVELHDVDLRQGSHFALGGLEQGMYGIEACSGDGEWSSERLFVELVEQYEPALIPYRFAMIFGAKEALQTTEFRGECRIRMDLSRLTRDGQTWMLTLPPYWSAKGEWYGLETRPFSLGRCGAEGSLDVIAWLGSFARELEHLLRGQLSITCGEGHTLVLEHEKELTSGFLSSAKVRLEGSWAVTRESLHDRYHLGTWIDEVTYMLGYRSVHVALDVEDERVLFQRELHAFQYHGKRGRFECSALLFVVAQGQDLVSIEKGHSLLHTLGLIARRASYKRIFVTDGKVWTMYKSRQRLRRRPNDFDEMMFEAHSLLFEEFLNDFMA